MRLLHFSLLVLLGSLFILACHSDPLTNLVVEESNSSQKNIRYHTTEQIQCDENPLWFIIYPDQGVSCCYRIFACEDDLIFDDEDEYTVFTVVDHPEYGAFRHDDRFCYPVDQLPVTLTFRRQIPGSGNYYDYEVTLEPFDCTDEPSCAETMEITPANLNVDVVLDSPNPPPYFEAGQILGNVNLPINFNGYNLSYSSADLDWDLRCVNTSRNQSMQTNTRNVVFDFANNGEEDYYVELCVSGTVDYLLSPSISRPGGRDKSIEGSACIQECRPVQVIFNED